jgi:hypothetical protein
MHIKSAVDFKQRSSEISYSAVCTGKSDSEDIH